MPSKKKDEAEIVECVTDAPKQGPLGEVARADLVSEADVIADYADKHEAPEAPKAKAKK